MHIYLKTKQSRLPKHRVLKILDDQQSPPPKKKENVSKNDPRSVTAGNASKMLILLPTELS